MNKLHIFFIILLSILILGFVGCSDSSGGDDDDVELSSNKLITSFSFFASNNSEFISDLTADIDDTDIGTSISSRMDRSNLIASFEATGVSVFVNGIEQISGVTANDFSDSVTYTVMAADDTSQNYIITFETCDSFLFEYLEYDYSFMIQNTTDNGYIISGATKDSDDSRQLIFKINKYGDLLWYNTFGSNIGKNFIWQLSDETFRLCRGYTIYNISNSGEITWERSFYESTASYLYINDIQIRADTGFLAGGFQNKYCGGMVNTDNITVKKVSAEIENESTMSAVCSSTRSTYVNAIDTTSDGGYIIAGYNQIEVWSGDRPDKDVIVYKYGGNNWNKEYGHSTYDDSPPTCIKQTNEGGYILGGTYPQDGYEQGWILKIDSAGNEEWDYSFGSYGISKIYSIKQLSSGEYLAVGYKCMGVDNNYDVVMIKLDYSGNVIWGKTYGGSLNDYGRDIVIDPSSDYYIVAAYTYSFDTEGSACWILMLDTEGNIGDCSDAFITSTF